MARPKLNIDGKLVEKMASWGAKTTEIADYFGCSVATLDGRFSEYLIKGRSNLKMSLRQWQLDAARKGNATMLIWLGKQMLGQHDIKEVYQGDISELPMTAEQKLAVARMCQDD